MISIHYGLNVFLLNIPSEWFSCSIAKYQQNAYSKVNIVNVIVNKIVPDLYTNVIGLRVRHCDRGRNSFEFIFIKRIAEFVFKFVKLKIKNVLV